MSLHEWLLVGIMWLIISFIALVVWIVIQTAPKDE